MNCHVCGYGTCRCGLNDENWKTVDEILMMLVAASKKLTPEQRATMTFKHAMQLARTPVGKLPKVK